MPVPDTQAAAVVRFAPSPNGRLHLGHAYSALYSDEVARRLGARFLLRIEDIDLLRTREAYVDGILEDLAWLGLVWEQPVRRQSQHYADYAAALDRLKEMGVAYPCFATRRDIADAVAADPGHARDPDGAPVYPGLSKGLDRREVERRLAAGVSHAWRLDMAAAAALAQRKAGGPLRFTECAAGPDGETGVLPVEPGLWGDVVVARKDIQTSYHLAVVVDDALQGVSHVTRGQDLFHATHIHRVLQVLLDLPEPVYHHHRLIRDEAQRKLSKSAGDTSLKSLREAGASAQDIRLGLGFQGNGR